MPKTSSKNQPNVIFVLTDDQGTGDLGCKGNPWIQTPHIDAFQEQAADFTDFHGGPTCAPTRASLLTGHYANSTGVWHTVGGRSLLRNNEITLASALSGAGYATGIFGKWHLGDNAPYRPQDRGFQHTLVHGGGGISQAPDFWGNDYFDDTYFENGKPKRCEGYCTEVWFNEAMKFIDNHKEKPFFCYLAPNAPHEPFNIMPEYRDIYKDKLDYTDDDRRERFYGMITHLDEQFGRLRSFLKERELEENTILVFMTDNGTAFGARFDENGRLTDGYNAGLRGIKCSEYDGGHRIPFFLRWPAGGVASATQIDRITSVVDFMPTILDLCGVDAGLSFHGDSLCPLMTGESSHWPERTMITDSQRVPRPVKWKQSSVMTDHWRLINGNELYDMRKDRGQTRNIAAENPLVVSRLKAEYNQWWNLVKPDFDNEIPISLGTGSETVRLSSHDVRNEEGDAVWHQGQIRQGDRFSGYWEVDIRKAGTYEIELCRWPMEGCGEKNRELINEDIPLNEAGVDEACRWFYRGSRKLDITRARIEINGETRQVHLDDENQRACFRLDLEGGPAHLTAVFTLADGTETGAFYTYVSRTG